MTTTCDGIGNLVIMMRLQTIIEIRKLLSSSRFSELTCYCSKPYFLQCALRLSQGRSSSHSYG